MIFGILLIIGALVVTTLINVEEVEDDFIEVDYVVHEVE